MKIESKYNLKDILFHFKNHNDIKIFMVVEIKVNNNGKIEYYGEGEWRHENRCFNKLDLIEELTNKDTIGSI